MEMFNNGYFSDNIHIPNKTPRNNPFFWNLDNDSNSNSHITYYNQVYDNSNINSNTNISQIQNIIR